jgi:hypothetical protein
VSGPPFRVVVVGIDGSRESEAALRFAADEAKLRGTLLRIVCASEPSASGYLGEAFVPMSDEFVHAEHHAEEVLRGALQQLKGEPSRSRLSLKKADQLPSSSSRLQEPSCSSSGHEAEEQRSGYCSARSATTSHSVLAVRSQSSEREHVLGSQLGIFNPW